MTPFINNNIKLESENLFNISQTPKDYGGINHKSKSNQTSQNHNINGFTIIRL